MEGPAADGFRKKIVLVVEDSPDHQALAEGFLLMGGYETACVADGYSALDYLHTHALPDVILLDLRMPGMDGFEFLAAQKREPELATIPVIVWSSEHHFHGERRLTRAVVCCVSKTDGSAVLLGAVRIAIATTRESWH